MVQPYFCGLLCPIFDAVNKMINLLTSEASSQALDVFDILWFPRTSMTAGLL